LLKNNTKFMNKLPQGTKLDFDDLLIEPCSFSEISSRFSDITLDEYYPIITAPMDTVVNEENVQIFLDNKINVCLPRGVNGFNGEHVFTSVSLQDFERIFVNNDVSGGGGEFLQRLEDGFKFYVCIDVANGHMKKMHDAVRAAKVKFGDKLVIMAGNVASAGGFYELASAGADYIRCGVGYGAGCFEDSTKVLTSEGKKPICEVENGEFVMTMDGTFKEVIGKVRYETKETLLDINGNICTESHEFFVIEKSKEKEITSLNLNEIGYWLEAKKINPEIHLIVELDVNE
jgi:hypothetical protein